MFDLVSLRFSPHPILFIPIRRVWLTALLAILISGSLLANPLNLTFEQWNLKIADDPHAVHRMIEQSWNALDPVQTPDIYLRTLAMDCLVRAQIGKDFRDEKIIEEGLHQAFRAEAWDEAILLTSCKARIRTKTGQYDEGRHLLEEAVMMAAQHGRSSLQIRTLVLLSDIHLYNNDLRKALALLQEAQVILENDNKLARIEKERLKVEIAMGLEAAGSHDVGIKIYESALQFFTQEGLRNYQVVMHYNLAVYYSSRGTSADLTNARAHFESAADIALSLQDELSYVPALSGIADIERQLKNYALAERLMEKAINVIKDKDSAWWAESLIILSAIKKDQSKFEEALATLQKAESILPKGEAATLESIKIKKEEIFLELERYQLAYELRKEVSESRIAKLKSDAEKEYSKLKVDLGLAVEEEKAALLQQENDRERKISYYKTVATVFLGALLLALAISMVWLKIQHDKIKSMQHYIQENVLQRFLPPQIIEGALSGNSPLDDAAQEATVTILFCDLVDFTSSSERLGADKIARVLNQFFKEMTDEIFETHDRQVHRRRDHGPVWSSDPCGRFSPGSKGLRLRRAHFKTYATIE
ncbi:tetratricopeptide repeat protein [Oligoflexus tunisiensis]|uniref:tetratricopeptide repeat protein n=1 Tax=Oligoflexus tunisiensis TaxID=708132 RepID=UPI00114C92DD|nr:tetratricopeptide repeat protein [Oligoflexus tunisiensis]